MTETICCACQLRALLESGGCEKPLLETKETEWRVDGGDSLEVVVNLCTLRTLV